MIGLIGPIGCGKSTVAGWLARRGAVVIDADELTRELMAPGTVLMRAIVRRFGAEFLLPDGTLDRARLGRLVFSDAVSLTALESIVHPAINERLARVVAETTARGPRAVVLEAIKLVEAGHAASCDEVWLVLCEPAEQLARLVNRGMDESDARQRVAAQAASLQVWRAAATRVLRTDGPPEEVERAVDEAFAETLGSH